MIVCHIHQSWLKQIPSYGTCKDWDEAIKNWKIAVAQNRGTEDQLMGTLHEVTLTLSDPTEDLEQHRKNMHQEHCFVCEQKLKAWQSPIKIRILFHSYEFAEQYYVPEIPFLPEYDPNTNSLFCRYCSKKISDQCHYWSIRLSFLVIQILCMEILLLQKLQYRHKKIRYTTTQV